MIGRLLRQAVRRFWRRQGTPEDQLDQLIRDGLAAQAQGAQERAEALWNQVLRMAPDEPRASHLLGRALAQRGRLGEAEPLLRRAAAVLADDAEVQGDLGNVLMLAQRWEEAERHYRAALHANPAQGAARGNLGSLLVRRGRWREAVDCLTPLLERDPANLPALRSLVPALVRSGRAEAALQAIAAATAAGADAAQLYAARGYVLLSMLRPAEARPLLEAALAVRPDDVETAGNLAVALQDLGEFDSALAAYDRALALRPDDADVRWHRSLALLLMGRFGEAWPDYELRLARDDWPARAFRYPRWDGSDPAGRTVLVYAEQGLGDEIMFASCIPDLLRAGARCIVECEPRLAALFARSFPAAVVHGGARDAPTDWLDDLQPVDFAIPIGSLPLHFRGSAAEFPKHAGYLRADPARVARWRERLDALGPGLKLGISWRGGTTQSRRALRSLDLAACAPLLRIPGAHWVSLQYDDCAAELERVRRELGATVLHWPEAIDDYEETAALVCALDQVVSVCTAIVHLAGALGRPVRVMAPLVPEWRYLAQGEAMPWYPSVRVYRQPRAGDWGSVVEAVARDLLPLRTGPS